MSANDQPQDNAAGLRGRAEALWRQQAADWRAAAPSGADPPLEEALYLIHELEMQNDELRRAQEEFETSRARYFELYDLEPVGYLTLSELGLIVEANLTAANPLSLERSQMVKQALFRFIVPDDQEVYFLYRRRVAANLQGNPDVGRLALLGMHERVEMLGGSLTIESSAGAGKIVYANVPL